MTHESIRETPDVPVLTHHEGSDYEPDCVHDCKSVVAAIEQNRWIRAWETVDLEKVR